MFEEYNENEEWRRQDQWLKLKRNLPIVSGIFKNDSTWNYGCVWSNEQILRITHERIWNKRQASRKRENTFCTVY